MWANIFKYIVANILLPLLKDFAFMLYNMFKVRQIRKEREEKLKKKLEAYEKNPSDENYGNLP
jgi:hypothetical protein